ncbi:TPA: signal peptidase I [Candidatus Collierbacteria bacterium]|uniref:Signal peptidase I n=1 Tax=Candidatus Collierbacteria bacterium GW2011_GWB2_44_22 TaxID=1618387 RepID=A0A0G1HWY0_9BACT|nr:MAG: Signal peptidase I [Candidatus Collierbacteria bacterium GW2011_GWA2_44_13]KKT51048.1 MAG: Signal peptidase I [Candidatus Collierbacteria bacterium GW2011_GWB1_44_197]KKT51596.1 MAG: Signal peptidase I [Candidatus Collierbacteria bacterium GW2011_GWB2_44_22]KKT63047.1 MAG: Signal peptidase I [Candidatus Collierbacteria bacterium GW2011_GWD1_44_27]KKT66438.1 MAG: Signal peptidase I [Candidatus Collierbacteria bacterium GW2011_GWC2_44_30]KKT68700.1 MAG: Signal peptidase I [Microgenomates
MSFFRKFVHIIYEFVEAFVISASVFVVVYLFLMQPHQVKGSSMFPTFKDKEYLLTDKVTYRARQPMDGDVIVFKAPINEDFDFIKRVIATPGQTVMVKEGKVFIDGQMLEEFYLPKEYTTAPGQFLHDGEEYTVQPNEIMAFGDNRDHSSDSRDWGPVPYRNIVGKVFFRYWPSNVAGLVMGPVKAKEETVRAE